jgi:hypothetical protein
VIAGLRSPGVCPECARPFNLSDPRSFITKVPFARWTFWFPGLALAVMGGTAASAVLAFGFGNWGYSLWLGVPFAAGCVLGYRTRGGWIFLVLLAAILVLGLILGVASLSLAGVYCGLVLGLIFAVPILVGVSAGATLRLRLKHSGFSQREYLPVFVFFLLPVFGALLRVALARSPSKR